MNLFGRISLLLLVFYFAKFSFSLSFVNQYLGNYYTMEEYRNLELACENKYCLSDANRLLVAATQNASIEPCDDFLTFTMEEFIKYGALHDRYPSVGFQGEVLRMLKLRQRKVVAAVITPNDSRPLKVAKNFFKNCVNSSEILLIT